MTSVCSSVLSVPGARRRYATKITTIHSKIHNARAQVSGNAEARSALMIAQYFMACRKANLCVQSVNNFFLQNFTDWFSVKERCDTLDSLLEKGCARDQLQSPVTKVEILQDLPLGRKTANDNSTQISPQKLSLKLRPGTSPEEL